MLHFHKLMKHKAEVIKNLEKKSLKELNILRDEWYKLYESAQKNGLKASAETHKQKYQIIEEALRAKRKAGRN